MTSELQHNSGTSITNPKLFEEGKDVPSGEATSFFRTNETLFDDKTVEQGLVWLNRLLRGEKSAEEAYIILLKDEKLTHPLVRRNLQMNQQDHILAEDALRQLVENWKGVPSKDSGMWGTFAEIVAESANMLSNDFGISALIKGEVHGREEYLKLQKEMLPNSQISQLCQSMLTKIDIHLQRLEQSKSMLAQQL